MLDIELIRKNPELIRKNLQKRNDPEKLKLLDDVKKNDEQWRKLKGEIDQLRAERNSISEKINEAKKAGKDIKKLVEKAKSIPQEIAQKEAEAEKIRTLLNDQMLRMPNLLHDSVPLGKTDADNVTIKTFGKKPAYKFPLKSHTDLIVDLGIADLERAAKISGARFWFLKCEGALLDLALQRYAVDFMLKKGYTLLIPPLMIKRKPYEGVTSLGDFEEMLYKIDGDDEYLIATSEHPLTAMFMDEILEEKDIPIKLIGISPCFRKEAGAHGKDTKGIFRGHQFTKVEQIIICKPEDSWKYHEELIKNAREFFETLGLHGRQVNICTADIGTVAAKKYDLEAWMPVQNTFREVVSCSNCTDYQSRRLNIYYRTTEGNKLVHTLNSTCVATSRALAAIIENFQLKDGSIKVPKVLVPYMNKIKIITR